MTLLRVARISFTAFVVVSLQVAVAAQLPIAGVIVDVVLIATIAAGLSSGPEAGAGLGFACGLLVDLMGAGPVGLTAFVYTLLGYAVGSSQSEVLRSARIIPIATAIVAAPAAVFARAFAGEVVGQHPFTMTNVPRVALVMSGAAAVLCLPIRRLTRWAFATDRGHRIQGMSPW